jgi:hypothetical protein
MIPDITNTIVLVTMPAYRNKIGIVSIAPPTIELNIARTVVIEEFTLSTFTSPIDKVYL